MVLRDNKIAKTTAFHRVDILLMALCCSLFFIPFYDFSRFNRLTWAIENYHLPLLALLMGGLLAFKPRLRHCPLRFNAIDGFLIAYFLYVAVHAAVRNPIVFGFDKFQLLATLVAVYLVLRTWLSSLTKAQVSKVVQLLLLALFSSLILHGTIAILQLRGDIASSDPNFRISGGFALVSHLAFYMGLGLPIAVGFYLLQKGKGVLFTLLRYTSFLSILMSTFILALSQNRSSWLMALAGLAFIFGREYLHRDKNLFTKLKAKPWALASVALATLIIASTAGYWLYHFKQGSSDGRVLVWKVLLGKVGENPVFGQGYNQVELRYGAWLIDWFGSGHGSHSERLLADQVRVSYNELLEILTETGLIGLFLFLGLVAALFFLPAKIPFSYGKSFGYTVLLSLLVCGLFSYPFSVPLMKVLFFMATALMASQAEKSCLSFRLHRTAPIGMGVGFLLIGLPLCLHIHDRSKVYSELDFGRELYATHGYHDALPYYEQASKKLKNDIRFLQEYAEILYHLGYHERSIAVLKKMESISPSVPTYLMMGNNQKELGNETAAEQAYMRAFHIAPSRFYPLYLIAKMYDDAGNVQKSQAVARQILSKTVKVDSPAIREIKREMASILEKPEQKEEV